MAHLDLLSRFHQQQHHPLESPARASSSSPVESVNSLPLSFSLSLSRSFYSFALTIIYCSVRSSATRLRRSRRSHHVGGFRINLLAELTVGRLDSLLDSRTPCSKYFFLKKESIWSENANCSERMESWCFKLFVRLVPPSRELLISELVELPVRDFRMFEGLLVVNPLRENRTWIYTCRVSAMTILTLACPFLSGRPDAPVVTPSTLKNARRRGVCIYIKRQFSARTNSPTCSLVLLLYRQHSCFSLRTVLKPSYT